MAEWAFSKGLHDIGNGCFAYVQPAGGTAQTNAGLVVDHNASLLIDTLYDLAHTETMLAAMRDARCRACCGADRHARQYAR
jgi:cyclase